MRVPVRDALQYRVARETWRGVERDTEVVDGAVESEDRGWASSEGGVAARRRWWLVRRVCGQRELTDMKWVVGVPSTLIMVKQMVEGGELGYWRSK